MKYLVGCPMTKDCDTFKKYRNSSENNWIIDKDTVEGEYTCRVLDRESQRLNPNKNLIEVRCAVVETLNNQEKILKKLENLK